MKTSKLITTIRIAIVSLEFLAIMILLFLYKKYPSPLIFMGKILKTKPLPESISILWGVPLLLILYIFKQFDKIMHPNDKRIYKWGNYTTLKIIMFISVAYGILGAACIILSILLKNNISAVWVGLLYLLGVSILFITVGSVFLAQTKQKEVLNSID